MTRLEALKELLAKVEAGSLVPDNLIVDAETSAQIDAAVNVSDLHGDAWAELLNAYDGSLDAAKALHEAMLPDASWFVNGSYRGDPPDASIDGFCVDVSSSNYCPARAWLIAIIKALIAMEQPA